MIQCLRCGKCCHYNGKKCKHLVILANGKSLCRIYPQRLGQKTGCDNATCHMREDAHQNYDGCPYNREEWKNGKNV